MRQLMFSLAALSLAVPPVAVLINPVKAEAKKKRQRAYVYTRNGRTYCRHSDGTTGLIAGGVGGALIGRSLDGGGLLGTALGAAGGALAGRAVDRTLTARERCR
ncbi:MAG: hypothetical protein A4S12_12335 [Proteobacteria bacterium SG_bin5]|nr:MAG: hypothetical protein A4S12_12335 [Proteobacteria bacterium SG_bin5]